jgi:hypothetical protein
MVANPARLRVLRLCEDCRVPGATEAGLDAYAGPPLPVPKSTEEWLR